MSSCIYLLDTNILLAAYKNYYAFDIAPSFWLKFNEIAKSGSCCIIDRVKEELIVHEDEITAWIKNEYAGTVLSSADSSIIASYKYIISSIQADETYNESARRVYADAADSWLVAHCVADKQRIIVTNENSAHSKKRIKIPVECDKYNLQCINTFEFLRKMRISF